MEDDASVAPSDFIEVYPDAVPRHECAEIVLRFQRDAKIRPGRVASGVHTQWKDSDDLNLHGRTDWEGVKESLNRRMFQCLITYARRHPHLLLGPFGFSITPRDGGPPHDVTGADLVAMTDAGLSALLASVFRPGPVNLQRYAADRGGYPRWHCEVSPTAGTIEPLCRALLWTLYLTEDFTGGETEFFHQRRSITPRVGAIVMAPTGFTHTHRGNTPRGGDKYIASSWVLFHPNGASPRPVARTPRR